uniref:Uncharacterized protein n=1 Tax=Lepeophtheirus salmonis TaxID=72036 RepID=A0A0K2V2W5_LEPSM
MMFKKFDILFIKKTVLLLKIAINC